MRIAVVGGGPGGLYFAALARQLDPEARSPSGSATRLTTRSASVWSSPTRRWAGSSTPTPLCTARWSVSSRAGTTSTSISSGAGDHQRRARLRRAEPAAAAADPAAALRPAGRDRALLRRGPGPRRARGEPRPGGGRRRRQLGDARRVRRHVPARPGRPAMQVHVARHRPGLRRVQVLHRADAIRRDADPRLPLRRDRQHVHRGDARQRLAGRRLRRLLPARPACPRAAPTRRRSSGSASCSPACCAATRCTRTTPSGSASAPCAAEAGGTAT